MAVGVLVAEARSFGRVFSGSTPRNLVNFFTRLEVGPLALPRPQLGLDRASDGDALCRRGVGINGHRLLAAPPKPIVIAAVKLHQRESVSGSEDNSRIVFIGKPVETVDSFIISSYRN